MQKFNELRQVFRTVFKHPLLLLLLISDEEEPLPGEASAQTERLSLLPAHASAQLKRSRRAAKEAPEKPSSCSTSHSSRCNLPRAPGLTSQRRTNLHKQPEKA